MVTKDWMGYHRVSLGRMEQRVVAVGVVAGLVKVANSKGQTDRLARILWLRGH